MNSERSIVFVQKEVNLPRVIWLEIAFHLKCAFKPTPFCYSYGRKALFYFYFFYRTLQDYGFYICAFSVYLSDFFSVSHAPSLALIRISGGKYNTYFTV